MISVSSWGADGGFRLCPGKRARIEPWEKALYIADFWRADRRPVLERCHPTAEQLTIPRLAQGRFPITRRIREPLRWLLKRLNNTSKKGLDHRFCRRQHKRP